MEKKKVNSNKKTIIILSSILISLLIAFTMITLAWFTDSKSFNSAVEFGVVEIDTSSGAATQSALSKTVTRSIGDYAQNGKVMPGDTINFSLRIKTTSSSEPAYYLVKVAGKGALSSLTSANYYYLNNNVSTTVSKTATGNARTCGTITSSETKTLNIPFVISTGLTTQGVSGEIVCRVAVIQQANITIQNAFDQLKAELDPPTVTFGDFLCLRDYYDATELGFYTPETLPSGYTLDSAKTTAIQSTLGASEQPNTLQVYVKDSTKYAFVNKGTIFANADCESLFEGCSDVTSIIFDNFDTSNVTSMAAMFYGCEDLVSLDVRNFNTSNVTDMHDMFSECRSLTSIDVRNFNTSNVTTLDGMFNLCTSLVSVDISNFDSSSVTDVNFMFSGCGSLTSIDVSHLNTSNVTDMRGMFDRCSGLTSLDLSTLDTSNVTDMSMMFAGCSNLTSLDLSTFDISNVTDMSFMFEDCEDLTSLDLSNFDIEVQGYGNYGTEVGVCVESMFAGCSSLSYLNISSFDFASAGGVDEYSATNGAMANLFSGCEELCSTYDDSEYIIVVDFTKLIVAPEAQVYFTYQAFLDEIFW